MKINNTKYNNLIYGQNKKHVNNNSLHHQIGQKQAQAQEASISKRNKHMKLTIMTRTLHILPIEIRKKIKLG